MITIDIVDVPIINDLLPPQFCLFAGYEDIEEGEINLGNVTAEFIDATRITCTTPPLRLSDEAQENGL